MNNLQEQQIDNAIKKNKELKLLGYLHSHPRNSIDDLMVLNKIYDLIKAKKKEQENEHNRSNAKS